MWYKAIWNKISKEKVFELEVDWKIELYQIYCKDFYRDNYFFTDFEYDIKSQITERNNRRKAENINWNKNLFTIYFEDFIKDIENQNQKIRLNSDCWFFIKKADENLEKNENHRKWRDKIIWNFNLSINVNKRLTNSVKEEKNIDEFNKIFNKSLKENKKEICYIWLDRWENELLTYWVFDKNLDCLKDENWNYLIWDLNCINQKWEFIKYENCLWKDKNLSIIKDLDFWLPTYSKDQENIKKFFIKDEVWYYKNSKTHNWKYRFYLLEHQEERYKIADEKWDEIWLYDNYWNRVINYYFLFQAELYKRYLLNKDENIKLEDIKELRWWYISTLINFLNKFIENKNYHSILVLEDLNKAFWNWNKNTSNDKVLWDKTRDWEELTNKEKALDKTFWSTIYQEIETLLVRKLNYDILDKEISKIWFQFTPKVKNISDIRRDEKTKSTPNLWNIIFVDDYLTSKLCPICEEELYRDKKDNDSCYHLWKNWCDFDTRNFGINWFPFIKSWDDLATYNISKRWKRISK